MYHIFFSFFISELKKVKKYLKMCKNWKYSKGTTFGVLVKNMKYVPHFVAQTVYVPQVPHVWHSCGTKSSPTPFKLKSSFREGISFLFSVFSRFGRGQRVKKGKQSNKYSAKVINIVHKVTNIVQKVTNMVQ